MADDTDALNGDVDVDNSVSNWPDALHRDMIVVSTHNHLVGLKPMTLNYECSAIVEWWVKECIGGKYFAK